jgi:hypothetical protein
LAFPVVLRACFGLGVIVFFCLLLIHLEVFLLGPQMVYDYVPGQLFSHLVTLFFIFVGDRLGIKFLQTLELVKNINPVVLPVCERVAFQAEFFHRWTVVSYVVHLLQVVNPIVS